MLTVLAHTVAGGGLPSVPWLVGVAGLVTLATAWVLRGVVRLPVMLPVLVLAQLGLHALFEALAPAGGGVGQAHGHERAHGAASPWWLEQLTPRMLVAHVLAAALTGVVWWLRRWVAQVVLSLATPAALAMSRPGPVLRAWTLPGSLLVWLVGDPGRAPPRALSPA